jgi:hypothetical protein
LQLVLVKLLETVKLPGNCRVPCLISRYELLTVRVFCAAVVWWSNAGILSFCRFRWLVRTMWKLTFGSIFVDSGHQHD